ncbi:TetR/AcrR family transcriptional regulator [Rurimicrobium arvi]|uniref:TetR/AcrR family transcriptional regulator n=2 Tax=Rurimicrobium arvi TaxID=2049916 RepID=A0ABP8MT81_9BACT
MRQKEHINPDASTEEKIKAAARAVFHEKGYAATRTRDIADAAGINLALLNYYFRSKEKLFHIIMSETLQQFFKSLIVIFNHPDSTLEQKIDELCARYIDQLLREPQIPLFIISELRSNGDALTQNHRINLRLKETVFARQLKERIEQKGGTPTEPIHLFLNLIGMTVFPFIAQPVLKQVAEMGEEQFRALMLQRSKMIPQWIKSML